MTKWSVEKITGFLAAVIGLVLVGSPAVGGEKTQEKVAVQFMATPIGAVAYTLGTALEDLLSQHHPWLRVKNGEGPGCTGGSYNLFYNEKWRKIITCTGPAEYSYAFTGVSPFKDKPGQEFKDAVKVLFNFNNAAVGLVTTDPNIKTARDLDGKRIGLGRRGQTAWGALAALVYKYGLPDVNVKLEYLGPMQAHDAVADGRVLAATSMISFVPDRSAAFLPGPPKNLVAKKGKVYPVSFEEATIERARQAGMGITGVLIDRDLVPELTIEEPVLWVHLRFAVAVHRDFPEEIAYELTKFVLEYADRFPKYHSVLEVMSTPERALGGWTEEYLHPGAARAFREAGVLD